LEKVGLFWKKPYFFFKRLKLDNLKKSRAFSKKALLFPEKALLFRLKLRTLSSIIVYKYGLSTLTVRGCVSLRKYKSQGKALEVTVNSKEENS
jgi:hypothetical protein